MKTILYLVNVEKFTRVFGNFPERKGIRQIVLAYHGCDENKFLIKDVRKLPKPKNKKAFAELANAAICDINPNVLVQATLVDLAKDYTGKRIFVSHGIAHPHLVNPRVNRFDLFCIGNDKIGKAGLEIPPDKLLINSMPQYDLLKQKCDDPRNSDFDKIILYAPSVISNSPEAPVKSNIIFKNIIKLAQDAEKYNYLIKLSIKNKYEHLLGKLKDEFRVALQSKHIYVINSETETIYDHYSTADIILVDTLVTTVVMESHILNKPVVSYLSKLDLSAIMNGVKAHSLCPPDSDTLKILGDGFGHDRVFQAIINTCGIDISTVTMLDCTLRDGGYYNNWNFSSELIKDYLDSMSSLGIIYIELGLRSLETSGFKGVSAFTTDSFIKSLSLPEKIKPGIMINASELINHEGGPLVAIEKLMGSNKSLVSFVRIACHVADFEKALPVSEWLHKMGYVVIFNLMQIAAHNSNTIASLSRMAAKYPLDVLYFADSLGSLAPERISDIISAFRVGWSGALGFHAHDNMGRAITNSLAAVESGVTWVDSTVTGMGRGPGNAQTEYLIMELDFIREEKYNIVPLLGVIRDHFNPMRSKYKWGTNLFYFLSGKHGIHPSFVQTMLSDNRYKEEDIFGVINNLKSRNSSKFNFNSLDVARRFYEGEPHGKWDPSQILEGRDVLIVGAGSGVQYHKTAIEEFVSRRNPFVIVLNTKQILEEKFINAYIACHPTRILIDSEKYINFSHKLITPYSMLPLETKEALNGKEVYDFGVEIKPDKFEFFKCHATIPVQLVLPYALAVSTSGNANKVFLAGFDGYNIDDPRHQESAKIFNTYQKTKGALPLVAITPVPYEIPCVSVYALNA